MGKQVAAPLHLILVSQLRRKEAGAMALFSGGYILENNKIQPYIAPRELNEKPAAKRTNEKKREAPRLNDLGTFLIIVLFVVYVLYRTLHCVSNPGYPCYALRTSGGSVPGEQGESWTTSSVSPIRVHENTGGMSR